MGCGTSCPSNLLRSNSCREQAIFTKNQAISEIGMLRQPELDGEMPRPAPSDWTRLNIQRSVEIE
jgi:hypothetical protein